MTSPYLHSSLFFFNDTATTEIYTLSLHDALPIFELEPCGGKPFRLRQAAMPIADVKLGLAPGVESAFTVHSEDLDRKSTRLNSSHGYISYAVFCLKKKNRGSSRPWARSIPARTAN